MALVVVGLVGASLGFAPLGLIVHTLGSLLGGGALVVGLVLTAGFCVVLV